MAEVTMETDWGAKGAQLTGAQVQAFIKDQLKQLAQKDMSFEEQLTEIKRILKNVSQMVDTDLPQQIQDKYDALDEAVLTLQQNASKFETEIKALSSKANNYTDVCRIAYYMLDDSAYLCSCTLKEWLDWKSTDPETAGNAVAMGVVVIAENSEPFIVGLEEFRTKWSKNNIVGLNNQAKDSVIAQLQSEYEPKARSRALCETQREQLFGTDTSEYADYAPMYCYNYRWSDGENYYDDWYLPDLRQILAMAKYKTAINACLSVIPSATLFAADYDYEGYWSANESSAGEAFYVNTMTGSLANHISKQYVLLARPVKNLK